MAAAGRDIVQFGLGDLVDLALLADVIAPPNRDDPEFFVRKAIGWALREVARWDPDWMRSYVAAHELSPLSRREALNHLKPPAGRGQPSSPAS